MATEEDDKLDIKGLIGEGGFGKVFLLENKKGERYALKVVKLLGQHPKELMQSLQEVKLLATLEHDYILKYVEASRQGLDLWIMTEYCPNGDLAGYIKANSGKVMEESRVLLWIRQITEALQYLHEHDPKIIHRDLKNANIFLDGNWDTKLGDFGIARILETPASMAQTQCGTLMYMSPELFMGIPYTERTDIYSLGIMMYEMCNMDKGQIQQQLILYKIVHMTVPSMPTGYSKGVIDLLKAMISKDPDDRPSAKQILGNDVFKTAGTPSPIATGEEEPEIYQLKDETERRTILGTLTLMRKFSMTVHTDNTVLAEHGEDNIGETGFDLDRASDEYETNQVMSLVNRTLIGMGEKATANRGDSMLQKQVEMLRVYCLQCLNNDSNLFNKASHALDSGMDEEDLEEALIRILGHEKYAMCGLELLHYKNFTFNLRQKKK